MNIKKNHQSGFTLIEISIVIIIVGLMLAGFVQAYTIYDAKQKVERTRLTMNDLQQNISNFPNVLDPESNLDASGNPIPGMDLRPFGRFPCPAPIDSASAGNNYSQENCAGAFRVGAGANTVLIGKFPAATLGLSNDAMKDVYGNFLTYAVSESATQSGTYGQPGAIFLKEETIDENNGTRVETDHTNVQYVIRSAGRDGRGAFSYAGDIQTPCDAGTEEAINCVDPAVGARPVDAQFLKSFLQQRDDTNGFDDEIRFQKLASSLVAPTDLGGVLVPAVEGENYTTSQEAHNNWAEVDMLTDGYASSAYTHQRANAGNTTSDNIFFKVKEGDNFRFEGGYMTVRDKSNNVIYSDSDGMSNIYSGNVFHPPSRTVLENQGRMAEKDYLFANNPSRPDGNINTGRSPNLNGGQEGNDGYYTRTLKIYADK